MALKIYKKTQPAFDLVITDETMPEMTGTELSKALLALTPKLPIILLSGSTEVALTQANENLSISHYLKKPVSLFDLKDTIEACLAAN
jgi:YesN/AraC family two-component response regulator